jgi:hypothetical protein
MSFFSTFRSRASIGESSVWLVNPGSGQWLSPTSRAVSLLRSAPLANPLPRAVPRLWVLLFAQAVHAAF